MTIMPAVPQLSLVSVTVSIRCFGDHSACSALVSLVSVAVSVRCFVNSSACSVSGVLGVYSCIHEMLL